MDLKSKDVKEILLSLLIITLIFFTIAHFLFNVSIIYGKSMEPEFTTGDRIITNIFQYNLLKAKPKRFEIVLIKCPYDQNKELIKRVIALGGEKIEIKQGEIFINGEFMPQDFPCIKTLENYGPYRIPNGELFVLGDNRLISEDSRYFGSFDEKLVIGKAQIKLWPINKAGIVR